MATDQQTSMPRSSGARDSLGRVRADDDPLLEGHKVGPTPTARATTRQGDQVATGQPALDCHTQSKCSTGPLWTGGRGENSLVRVARRGRMTCPIEAPDTFGQCHWGGLDSRQNSLPPRALGVPPPHVGPRNLSQGGAAPAAEPCAQLPGPARDCSRVLVLLREMPMGACPDGTEGAGPHPWRKLNTGSYPTHTSRQQRVH